MATEGKEKKRKATTSVAPTHPPHKKSKNSTENNALSEVREKKKLAPIAANHEKLQKSVPSSVPQSSVAPTSTSNDAVTKSKKARKRAADFLSDDESKSSTKNTVPSEINVATTEEPDKPKKKSKKSKVGDKFNGVNGTAATTEIIETVPVVNISAKPEKNKKKQDRVATTKDKIETKPESGTVQKKPKPSAAGFHADKLEQLLSTNYLNWPDKKKEKQPQKTQHAKETLTADGVNGVVETSGDENLGTATANDSISTSLQAEAQRTTEQELEDAFGGFEEQPEEQEDDQGAALLAGFDSDGEDDAADEDFDLTKPINISKNFSEKLEKTRTKHNQGGPGTLYVGRIPHGFYEAEMRQYFSQFGTISKLRLSRNRRTGNSKHFAFIEFESTEVAQIVAKAMDNYLMFGHILKCKFAPQEILHPDVWKGANKRFKRVPYSKIEKKKLEEPKTKTEWEKKSASVQKKREAKVEKLKEMGYEIELPKMKSPGDVLERRKLQLADEQKLLESAKVDDGPVGALEPPNGVPKDEIAMDVSKKPKKDKKGKANGEKVEESVADIKDTLAIEKAEPEKPKKEKKSKKDNASKVATIAPISMPKPGEQSVSIPEISTADPAVGEKNKRKEKREKKKPTKGDLGDQLTSSTGVLVPEIKDKPTVPTAPATSESTLAQISGREFESPANKTEEAGKAEKKPRKRSKRKSAQEKETFSAPVSKEPELAPADKRESSKKHKSDGVVQVETEPKKSKKPKKAIT